MLEFNNPIERIMVALDFDDFEDGLKIVKELEGMPVTFKVGLQLGTRHGWQPLINAIHGSGSKIFCDAKFKDIPNTVEKACRAITRLEPDFFNIMADNSPEALAGAVRGVESAMADFGLKNRPTLLGVTVLTSIDEATSQSIYGGSAKDKVVQFATMAHDSGLNGVVCSPQEAQILRSSEATRDLVLVTPGIRPEWAVDGDQSRVLTPVDAVKNGSDYLVIGRPITQPPAKIGSARKAVEEIIKELS